MAIGPDLRGVAEIYLSTLFWRSMEQMTEVKWVTAQMDQRQFPF